MTLKKNYDGYKAYSYLEEGVDYPYFKYPSATKRVEPYLLSLNEVQEKRLLEVVDKSIIISLHDHPVFFPEDMKQVFEYNREGRQVAAYEALSKSYLDVVFDNLMDGTNTIGSKNGWKWNDVLHDLGIRLCDLAHQNFIIRAEKVEDLYRAHNEGKMALVPTIEGAAMLENEVDRVEILYGFGVRLMGITYSEGNSLGAGLKEKNDGGLMAQGYKVVERMNKVGMAIDCSHVGDNTTIDVIEASKHPIFMSHCGARQIWNTRRLKPDHVIKACAAKGGVIGIEAAPHTTLTVNNLEHNIEGFMEHFEYVKDLVGIDFVAFGPDTLYGDHVALHHAFAQHLSIQSSHEGSAHFQEVPYVKGLENPTEASLNIVRWLVKHNYSDGDIAKVLGGNVIRVLKEVWV